MDPRRLITVLILLVLATPAFGQFVGTFQPGGIYANPSASEAAPIDATMSAILDRTIGSTAGTIPIRGASTWGPGTNAGATTLSPGNVLGNPTASPATGTDASMTAILDRAFGTTVGNVLQRGASVWSSAPVSAPSLSSGNVYGNATAGTANASDTTLTALFDRVYGTTVGTVPMRGASTWGASSFAAGNIYGNSTASTSPGAPTTLTALMDRGLGSTVNAITYRGASVWQQVGVPQLLDIIFSSTRGAILERAVAGWNIIAPGTAGLPFVSAGPGADPGYVALTATGLGPAAAATNIGNLGGVLGGSLPNPTMAAGAAAANIGSLGGALSGTLPNPSLAAGTAVTSLAAGPGVSVSGSTGAVTIKTIESLVGTSTPPTITSANCGQHYYLAGGFFTVTLPAASGFPFGCKITFTNTDTTKGKTQSISGLTLQFPVLWPGQTSEFTGNTVNWTQTGIPGRWQLPCGTFNINIDPTNGSDTVGISDGLGTGAEAFQSFHGALDAAMDNFLWSGGCGGNPTVLTLLLCPVCTSTELIHFSPSGGGPGATGGASITFDLNGGTLTNSGNDTIQCYFGAVLRIRNGLLGSVGGNIINALEGCKVVILDGVTFGNATAAMIFVQPISYVQLPNSITIAGNAQYFILVSHGAINTGGPITATISNNISFSGATVQVQASGLADLNLVTWALGGHTVTATNKWNVSSNGVIFGSAAIPGSGAGTSASGGQPL